MEHEILDMRKPTRRLISRSMELGGERGPLLSSEHAQPAVQVAEVGEFDVRQRSTKPRSEVARLPQLALHLMEAHSSDRQGLRAVDLRPAYVEVVRSSACSQVAEH